MIIICKYIFYKRYVGLSIWPFIILKDKALREDKVLLNHEKIHLQQQAELLVLPFYLMYLGEWLIRALRYRDFYKAYLHISFEREAYANENNLDYCNKRRLFAFIKYLWGRKTSV